MPHDHVATLQDVADLSGVSRATASFALSGRGRVAEATRRRVREAAAALRYEANIGARNLRRARSGAVGLYLPRETTSLSYYMELAFGAVDGAQRAGLSVTLVSAEQAMQALAAVHVDGFVVIDPLADDPAVAQILAGRRPVVSGERVPAALPRPAATVGSDHRRGIRVLLDHLGERGASRPAIVAPGTNSVWSATVREGYREWCAERDVQPLIGDVPFAATPEEIARATAEVLAGRPDGLIAVPDGAALVALSAARAAGRDPGVDLLIAAYVDDSTLQLAAPAITALDLHPRELGRVAMLALLEVLAGADPAPVPDEMLAEIPVTLNVRASSSLLAMQRIPSDRRTG